jgi:hypothetical protein
MMSGENIKPMGFGFTCSCLAHESVSNQNLLKHRAEEVSNLLGHARTSQDLAP